MTMLDAFQDISVHGTLHAIHCVSSKCIYDPHAERPKTPFRARL